MLSKRERPWFRVLFGYAEVDEPDESALPAVKWGGAAVGILGALLLMTGIAIVTYVGVALIVGAVVVVLVATVRMEARQLRRQHRRSRERRDW